MGTISSSIFAYLCSCLNPDRVHLSKNFFYRVLREAHDFSSRYFGPAPRFSNSKPDQTSPSRPFYGDEDFPTSLNFHFRYSSIYRCLSKLNQVEWAVWISSCSLKWEEFLNRVQKLIRRHIQMLDDSVNVLCIFNVTRSDLLNNISLPIIKSINKLKTHWTSVVTGRGKFFFIKPEMPLIFTCCDITGQLLLLPLSISISQGPAFVVVPDATNFTRGRWNWHRRRRTTRWWTCSSAAQYQNIGIL